MLNGLKKKGKGQRAKKNTSPETFAICLLAITPRKSLKLET
jgi:hypothetical protein